MTDTNTRPGPLRQLMVMLYDILLLASALLLATVIPVALLPAAGQPVFLRLVLDARWPDAGHAGMESLPGWPDSGSGDLETGRYPLLHGYHFLVMPGAGFLVAVAEQGPAKLA